MSILPCELGKRIVIHESPVSNKRIRITSETLIPNDHLCQRCTSIAINNLMTRLDQRSHTSDPYLGDIEGIKTHDSCHLCQLLDSVHVAHHSGTATSRRSARYYLRTFESHRVFEARVSATCSLKEVGVVLGVCRATPKYRWSAERRRCFTKGFIAPLPDRFSLPCQFQVQKVQPNAADFGQIREWIQICREKHRDTCTTKPRKANVQLECIDIDHCDGMRPTKIGNDEQYLALSYVCAEAEDVALRQEGQTVSQSIQDAMTVTRALGFRYLWIDKYCINQDDHEEKQRAIANMDSIYEAAAMTIIAAAAPDFPPGLPGISRERGMLKQPTARVGQRTWTSTLPHLSAAISSSAWKTRGWTYQEVVLSTRCLYFTDVQVYFVCQCATACESLSVLPNTDLQSLGASTSRSYPFETDLTTTSRRPLRMGLSRFFQDLYNYKSRNLTYDSDSLNAFQGILERSGFKTVWGIPVVHRSHDILVLSNSDLALKFVRGLWWENPGHPSYDQLSKNHPHASFRRIPHFPSWSWCGWSGSITPHKRRGDVDSDNEFNAVDETSPAIKIYFETECGLLKNPKQIMMNAALRLSHTLRIATTTHVVRIRLPTATHQMPYLCNCSINKETCTVPHPKVQFVRMFQHPFAKDEPSEGLFTRKWHVIRLFTLKRCTSTPDPVSAAFIIDWDGNREHCAQVVGVAYIGHNALDGGTRNIVMLR
jgi:hypothetical protein